MMQSTSPAGRFQPQRATASRFGPPLLTWFLVLPATILLVSAALRFLQPRAYEPARTAWLIFDWTTSHVSHLGAAALFLILPGFALVIGAAMLWRTWLRDEALRKDAAIAFAVLRRQFVTVLLAAATLLAGTILAAVVVHLITD